MIRWLVIGGGKAAAVHAHAIGLCSAAELAGFVVVSQDPRLPGPAFPTLEDALDQTAVDAAVIATPHDTHLSYATRLLDAGVPVLCEKPAGLNVEESRQIAASGGRAGVAVGIVLNQRACRHHRYIHELTRRGRLQPVRAQISATLGPLSGWPADRRRSGGGVLRTVGVHYLDLLRWWFGPASELSAHLSGYPVESVAVVTARYGEQCLGTLSINMTGSPSRGPVSCQIDGTDGSLTLVGHEIVAAEGLPTAPPVETLDAAQIYGPGHAVVIDEATRALAAGNGFPVPLEEALPSLALVDDAYS